MFSQAMRNVVDTSPANAKGRLFLLPHPYPDPKAGATQHFHPPIHPNCNSFNLSSQTGHLRGRALIPVEILL